MYDFFEKKKLMHSLEFDFLPHCSTSYALLNLAQPIMKALDKDTFACGIFFDLQKVFDTVEILFPF